MAYTVDTFFPRGKLRDSQPEFLQNYMAINDLIGVDHADFADPNAGMHNKLTFTQFPTMPVTLNDEVNIVGFLGTGGVDTIILATLLQAGTVTGFLNVAAGVNTASLFTLPSGIGIRAFTSNFQGNDPNGDYTIQLSQNPQFTSLFWAIIIPSSPRGTDPRMIAYVRSFPTPNSIRFSLFQRDGFDIDITNYNQDLSVIAIGV